MGLMPSCALNVQIEHHMTQLVKNRAKKSSSGVMRSWFYNRFVKMYKIDNMYGI